MKYLNNITAVRQVKETSDVEVVNQLLNKGWMLLATVRKSDAIIYSLGGDTPKSDICSF